MLRFDAYHYGKEKKTVKIKNQSIKTKANDERYMTEETMFDQLMSDVTSGKLKDDVDLLMARMEEVIADEGMGTMDDMMNELGEYLTEKDKISEYLDENGDMKMPLETVFSWFKKSIESKRKGLR